jgi:hypothetical protein
LLDIATDKSREKKSNHQRDKKDEIRYKYIANSGACSRRDMDITFNGTGKVNGIL